MTLKDQLFDGLLILFDNNFLFESTIPIQIVSIQIIL